jgi:hypothetical protein
MTRAGRERSRSSPGSEPGKDNSGPETGEHEAAGFRPTLPRPPVGDRWIGTRELPGYRAGSLVVKLADLPGVDAEHLYCDLMLLDAQGRTEDTLSGPCRAVDRRAPLEDRSAFVRVVAELLRHAVDDERGIAPLGPVLAHIREHGVQPPRLAAAALLLDSACSEQALIASLTGVLALSLGEEEAHAVLCGVVEHLARSRGFAGDIHAVNEAGLPAQVAAVVNTLGRAHARRYLREVTDFELLPRPEMFGLFP